MYIVFSNLRQWLVISVVIFNEVLHQYHNHLVESLLRFNYEQPNKSMIFHHYWCQESVSTNLSGCWMQGVWQKS